MDPFRHLTDCLQVLIKLSLNSCFTRRQRGLPIVATVDNKYTHGHSKVGKCFPIFSWSATLLPNMPCVLDGTKTLVMHELDLIHKIIAALFLNIPSCGA